MQFVSMSEKRRAESQLAKKTARQCAHLIIPDGMPYRASSAVMCQKPAIVDGQHGWLCDEHKAMQAAAILNVTGKRRAFIDMDKALVEGIIASEARAIANGKVTQMRFGALDPSYLRMWEEV